MSKKQIICPKCGSHEVQISTVNAELLGEKVDDLGDVVSEKVHEVKDKLSNKE